MKSNLFVVMAGSFLICCSCMRLDLNSIDKLTKNGQYDKRIRPFIGDKPVNISTQIYIASLGPLNEQTFTFDIGFYHRQWWMDPRLRFNKTFPKLTHDRSPDELIWIPDAQIINARKVEKIHKSVRTIINSKGDIYVSQRLSATCSCNMDLHYYPMDTQYCPFILESYAFTRNDVQLFWHKNAVLQAHEDSLQLAGYHLKEISSKRINVPYVVGNITEYYDNLMLTFIVERSFVFYIYRAYAPTVTMMIFNMASYWIPDHAVPARVTLIVTTLLASAVILQSVTEQTVKVTYTTPMQLFLVINVLFIVASIVEYVIVIFLRTNIEVDPLQKTFDKKDAEIKSRKSFINGAYDVCEHDDDRKRNDDIKCDEKEIVKDKTTTKENIQSQYKEEKKVHKLDEVFRIAVPVLYVAVCCVYFASYFGFR